MSRPVTRLGSTCAFAVGLWISCAPPTHASDLLMSHAAETVAALTDTNSAYSCKAPSNNYQTSYIPTFPTNPQPPSYNLNASQPKVIYLGGPKYPAAICNDSSPAVYLLRPAPNNGHMNRWIIHLQEGLSCYNQGTDNVTGLPTPKSNCGTRSKSFLSTKDTFLGFWPPANQVASLPIQTNIAKYLGYSPAYFNSFSPPMSYAPAATSSLIGISSPDSINNPDFWDANMVFVPYCSSDTWSGNRSAAVAPLIQKNVNVNFNAADPTFNTWSFQGKPILKAVITDLWNNQGMSSSGGNQLVELLFTGSSSGGLGVFKNINDVVNLVGSLSSSVRLLAMADGGFGNALYPDYDPNQPSPFLSTTMPRYAVMDAQVHSGPANSVWQATGDASCEQDSAVTNKPMCMDPSSVAPESTVLPRQYIQLPIFISQNMQDSSELLSLGLNFTGGLANKPSNPAFPYIQRFIDHSIGALIPFMYSNNTYSASFVANGGAYNNISAGFENVEGDHMLTNDKIFTTLKTWKTSPADASAPSSSYSTLLRNFFINPCSQVLVHQ